MKITKMFGLLSQYFIMPVWVWSGSFEHVHPFEHVHIHIHIVYLFALHEDQIKLELQMGHGMVSRNGLTTAIKHNFGNHMLMTTITKRNSVEIW